MTRGAAGSARRPRRRLASEGPPRPAQADGTLRVARERRAGSAASSLLVPIATKMPHRAPAPHRRCLSRLQGHVLFDVRTTPPIVTPPRNRCPNPLVTAAVVGDA